MVVVAAVTAAMIIVLSALNGIEFLVIWPEIFGITWFLFGIGKQPEIIIRKLINDYERDYD